MVWHVDDLKMPNVESGAVKEIIAQIRKQYGNKADLTVHRKKVHKYLGMRLDYHTQDNVNIDMTEHL